MRLATILNLLFTYEYSFEIVFIYFVLYSTSSSSTATISANINFIPMLNGTNSNELMEKTITYSVWLYGYRPYTKGRIAHTSHCEKHTLC